MHYHEKHRLRVHILICIGYSNPRWYLFYGIFQGAENTDFGQEDSLILNLEETQKLLEKREEGFCTYIIIKFYPATTLYID